jgi:small subunit ribosomal protein S4
VRERQFRRYVREAKRTLDALTGDRLLQILELRLDNVLVRLGFATTRAQARQFVVHGHVEVNGRRCDIPSRRLAEGDVVAIPQSSPVTEAARQASELVDRVTREPHRDEIQTPVDEQLIVEYYSRV